MPSTALLTSSESYLRRIGHLLTGIAVVLIIFIVGVIAGGWWFRDAVRDAKTAANSAQVAAKDARRAAAVQLRFSKDAVKQRQAYQEANLRIACRLLDQTGIEDKACLPKP